MSVQHASPEIAMATRTSRLELRADPDRERRIRFAAELSRQSSSAFVLDAAGEKAERVIAASTATHVPPAFFDLLWSALDTRPRANAALRRRAAGPRRVQRR
jgi:uncharacterized protein (DUF1778 family)